MTWRHVALYFIVLFLACTVVFTLSLGFVDDGKALQWEAWPIW